MCPSAPGLWTWLYKSAGDKIPQKYMYTFLWKRTSLPLWLLMVGVGVWWGRWKITDNRFTREKKVCLYLQRYFQQALSEYRKCFFLEAAEWSNGLGLIFIQFWWVVISLLLQ